MSRECARWKCDNDRYKDHATCVEHPPLVNHGLTPNETVCPECGEKGMGTIHNTMWYCLDEHGYDGCGALHNPYVLADVKQKPRWNPEEAKHKEG